MYEHIGKLIPRLGLGGLILFHGVAEADRGVRLHRRRCRKDRTAILHRIIKLTGAVSVGRNHWAPSMLLRIMPAAASRMPSG